MAVTGPFSRTDVQYWSGSSGPRKLYDTYWWYRNGPGPRTPHPFKMVRTRTPTDGADAPNLKAGYFAQDGVPYFWSAYIADVHNKAYAKFVNAAQNARSSLGTSLAEWGQSRDMIAKRGGQLMRAAKALKRGYPYEFFRELGMLHRIPRRTPNRTDPKKAADLWLEWWFGWSPLIGDIFDSIEVLQDPPSFDRQVVRGRASSGWLLQEQNWIGPYYRTLESYSVNMREQIQATVSVSNPNLRRATQLGLINPVSIAWELVPFSFVVDWFIPVGQFLEGWTDLLGLTIEQPHTTITRAYKSDYTLIETWPPGTYNVNPTQKGLAWEFQRSMGYSGTVLAIRPYKGISLTRAATAISLLVQQLNNLR